MFARVGALLGRPAQLVGYRSPISLLISLFLKDGKILKKRAAARMVVGFCLLITQGLFGRHTGRVGQITGQSDKLRGLFTALLGQITGTIHRIHSV